MIVLLDTHALLWLATDDARLGKRSRAQIRAATQNSSLAVSAISFWEIALLIEKGRLRSTLPALALRQRLLQAGVNEIPLSGDIALAAAELSLHGDPADRFIAASAISNSAILLTADDKLLAWKHTLKRQDARR